MWSHFYDFQKRFLMSNYQDYEVLRLKKLRSYKDVFHKTKIIIRKIDPGSRIIFFGSVLRGDYNACSDIDLIVIPSDSSLRDKITVAVWKKIDAPIELHIISNTQFEEWYLRFIDKYQEL